jgi:hypothetical protein
MPPGRGTPHARHSVVLRGPRPCRRGGGRDARTLSARTPQHEKRLVREPLKMHPYVSAGSARSATSICVELAGRCVNRLRLLHALKDEAVLRRSNRPPSRPGALRFTIQSDGQSGGRRPGIPGRLPDVTSFASADRAGGTLQQQLGPNHPAILELAPRRVAIAPRRPE